ncbi:MBL fold metallo-hydrolase [Leptothoe spongobia]|uniref:MBL fold metallo-hydrolase n=1 Tax=Leptothoe spongobia TAU-MAC 1115 TaxID=1967444 RepID=A0A947GIU5_9CYAN|nr:MBL fold metallo-hydrolase [Leptothoe spongobia]MBT9315478.1 MBL fold metallo-hydrolase [Leptothoe spongobia TAU-MAC 1115]
MKRRQLLQNASAAFISTLGLGIASNWQAYQAQTGTLRITSLGHMCFKFAGSGKTILTNPFDPRGCTQGYRAPSLSGTDLILVSSRLLDEGFIPEAASVNLLDEPGAYEINGLSVQGVGMPHDREGGRRFGINTAWLWTQAGINVVHLGGAAAPIDLEDKILIGRPDVLLVPVGGGPKAYNPAEAVATVKSLQPKVVIPTQYRTNAASSSCELEAVDEFLGLMAGTPIDRVGSTLTLQGSSLPANGMRIKVLS